MLKADVYHYITLSDGIKYTYTNDDELEEYGNRGILNPNDVSYYSLFINGVLQPKANYELQEGLLTLTTEDLPLAGSSIIICFVTLREDEYTKLNYARARACLHRGDISIGPVSDMDIMVQDYVNPHLILKKQVLSGPEFIHLDSLNRWKIKIKIINKGETPISDLEVKEDILLDLITDVQSSFKPKGEVSIDKTSLIWKLDILEAGESATLVLVLEGLFKTGPIRFLSRSYARGLDTGSGDEIVSQISSGKAIKVLSARAYYEPFYFFLPLWKKGCEKPRDKSPGLNIRKYLLLGPQAVNPGEANTWLFEIRIDNDGKKPVDNVVVEDRLLVDGLDGFRTISLSQGQVSRQDDLIRWDIGCLRPNSSAVLVGRITGYFNHEGYVYKGENHQYNTLSDGSKTTFTDYDELTDYGNLGLPDPESISFFNLFINGVLQPRVNYNLEEGVLTLLTEDTPIAGAPIMLEYFKVYDKDNQLLRADIYHYNALSNGGKVYTNADEISSYGDGGIMDPDNSSYYNLFINGVIQPAINYRVEEGLLELKTEDAPIIGAPITLQFISFTS